jgi:hypothetical protein
MFFFAPAIKTLTHALARMDNFRAFNFFSYVFLFIIYSFNLPFLLNECVKTGVEITTRQLAKCEWNLKLASIFLNLLASLASVFSSSQWVFFPPLIQSYSSPIPKYKHTPDTVIYLLVWYFVFCILYVFVFIFFIYKYKIQNTKIQIVPWKS